MKVSIIGAGIAGLTLGALLKKRNIEYKLFERTTHRPRQGHSFLISQEAVQILEKIIPENKFDQLNLIKIDNIEIRNLKDEVVRKSQLKDWWCVRRIDLVKVLFEHQESSSIYLGREVQDVALNEKDEWEVHFRNGEKVNSDLIIASDGSNSKIREFLFGKTQYSQQTYKEILFTIRDENVLNKIGTTFVKYMADLKPANFNIIRTSKDNAICVCQIPKDALKDNLSEFELKIELLKIYENFPPIVKQLISIADFELAFIWHAKDMEVMPQFHRNNILLIGDAAHLTLPFTSSGITHSMKDAEVLADLIQYNVDRNIIYESFYASRKNEIQEHLGIGRIMWKQFLDNEPIEKRQIPLVNFHSKVRLNHLKVTLRIFTDPICSTCWLSSPDKKKFKLIYGDVLDERNYMGGLLPSWENFNRGPIKTPMDAYHNWKESGKNGMRMDGKIWEKNPIMSSFTPSVYFKAVVLAYPEKAELFYRMLQEKLFLENVKIDIIPALNDISSKMNLDVSRISGFLKEADEAFDRDLILVEKFKINVLPTYIFEFCGQKIKLEGFQTFEQLESALLSIDDSLEKRANVLQPSDVLQKYESLLSHELSKICDRSEEEIEQLISSVAQIERRSFDGEDVVIYRNNSSYKEFEELNTAESLIDILPIPTIITDKKNIISKNLAFERLFDQGVNNKFINNIFCRADDVISIFELLDIFGRIDGKKIELTNGESFDAIMHASVVKIKGSTQYIISMVKLLEDDDVSLDNDNLSELKFGKNGNAK